MKLQSLSLLLQALEAAMPMLSQRNVSGAFFALASVFALGCEPDLGPCDMTAARTVAYDEDGFPMYEGQALIETSCGSGAFCHSARAEGAARYGVPKGLDWDMQLASTTGAENPEGVARLANGQANVYEWRHEIYDLVSKGEMPPRGDVLDVVLENQAVYGQNLGTDDEVVLPSIGSSEGRAKLKNWLACGSPVVERIYPLYEHPTTVGSIEHRAESAPPEPTWTEIYPRIIERRCTRCHREDAPEFATHQLDMSDISTAYDNLVGEEARGEECMGMGALVVRGDPDASLLLDKLESDPMCGERMPRGSSALPDDLIEPIREWIAMGALDN